MGEDTEKQRVWKLRRYKDDYLLHLRDKYAAELAAAEQIIKERGLEPHTDKG